jgi:carbon-monoxide dehydrogenase iron sulfur subunit
MRNMLFLDVKLCTGCMNCVLFCSQYNEDVSGPSSARIFVDLNPLSGEYVPLYCLQCKKAACAEACPVGSISKRPGEDYWSVNYETCIGCRACVTACPFGAMFIDPVSEKVLKCETCGGDPLCARVCPTQALFWGNAADRKNYQKTKAGKRSS